MADLPEKILVLDDDDSIRQLIESILVENGCEDIACFDSGDTAYEACVENQFDFIIMDWRIPGLSGLGFLNRLRQLPKYTTTPVVVISGFLSRKDFSLLAEMPFSGKLEKPFSGGILMRTIKDLQKEWIWYLSQEKKIRATLAPLNQGAFDLVLNSVQELLSESPKPLRLCIFAAKQMRLAGAFAQAEVLLVEALKKNPLAPLLLNELGKLKLAQGEHKAAQEQFLKALEQSPDNIERLCHLADISLQAFDTDHARVYLEKAAGIDSNNEQVKAGVTIANNIDEFFQYNEPSSVPDTYAGLLNAIGITMVREGSFDRGIEHYQSAMRYLNKDELRSKLAFNLGLGYTRWKRYEEALQWFKKSTFFNPNNIKASEYITKLKPRVSEDAFAAPATHIAGLDKAEAFDSNNSTEEDGLSFETSLYSSEDADATDPFAMDDDQVDLTSSTSSHEVEEFEFNEEADSESIAGVALEQYTLEEIDRELLEMACPEIVNLFQAFQDEGGYVDNQIRTFAKLLLKFGKARLQSAVSLALTQGQHSGMAVANILENNLDQAS